MKSFARFAERTAACAGTAMVFVIAVGSIVVWAALGPSFQFSDTWQLVINTGTTIITFLMVFLIQNTQYRDARAVQLKLDELLRVTHGAHIGLIDLEELDEAELKAVQNKYHTLAQEAHAHLKQRKDDKNASGISSI